LNQEELEKLEKERKSLPSKAFVAYLYAYTIGYSFF
jgi:hypothetical protein